MVARSRSMLLEGSRVWILKILFRPSYGRQNYLIIYNKLDIIYFHIGKPKSRLLDNKQNFQPKKAPRQSAAAAQPRLRRFEFIFRELFERHEPWCWTRGPVSFFQVFCQRQSIFYYMQIILYE